MWAWLACWLAVGAPSYDVVVAGQPRATIVVAAEASAQVQEAAGLFQQMVQESTGARLPLAAEAPATGLVIQIGRGPATDVSGYQWDTLDGDGFVLAGVDDRTYVVAGPTDWGTEFGVYELLERAVGVRWLLPGPDGTVVPKQADLRLPGELVRQEPVYFSRQLSGWRGAAHVEFARRNRMHGRINFHHNLLHLFPQSVFAKDHPEFYPILKGERYLPIDDADYRWQPNFSAPGIVEAAAERIKEYFREHPEAPSYSLGINDVRLFDESPESLARESGKQNYLGQRDVSDSYYRWCNEVIEEVLKEFPDKWFGCLAYNNVFEPPSFKVHPRLVPYLTYDRMKWVDDDLRAEGEEISSRWAANATTLGWYDYAYGSPYLLPRVYPHQMQKYLSWGAAHGVRVHYAELYPNFGEGPKPYVFLKLQWNPNQDVDALLNDWYEHAVGPAAAPLLAEYYAIWERFWTHDVLESSWFTPKGQYLPFNSPGYLADVNLADVHRSRELLDQVVAKAGTPGEKARAELLRTAFGYYEASALSYSGGRTKAASPPTSEAEALAALEPAIERLILGQRQANYPLEHADDPVLVLPLSAPRYPALAGSAFGAGAIWGLLGWVQRSEAVRQAVTEGAATGPQEARDALRTVLALADGTGPLVSENPSFEDAGLGGWSTWSQDVGSLRIVDGIANTGQRSCLADGLNRGGPHRILKPEPGRYVAMVSGMVPEGQDSRGTIEVTATFLGEKGQNLSTPSAMMTPVPGQWSTIVCPLTIPAELRGEQVTGVRLIAIINGFKPGELCYVDDLGLYRLPLE